MLYECTGCGFQFYDDHLPVRLTTEDRTVKICSKCEDDSFLILDVEADLKRRIDHLETELEQRETLDAEYDKLHRAPFTIADLERVI